MEYSLKEKRNAGILFSFYDPFRLSQYTYSVSFSPGSIPLVIDAIHKNYEVKKISIKGGIDIDYYILDPTFFWDKRKKVKYNKKTNNLLLLIENGLPNHLRPTWDEVTNKRILTLDKRLQNPARAFINTVEEELGIQLRIVQALRTIAEQNALYNQGRTTPGAIVTKAKGGTSYHNYALAMDVVMIEKGQAVWTILPKEVVKIGEDLGFEWGGTWKGFKDYPHFQMTFGQSIRDLQNKK
ncbi:M15 family metallopeptidase [Pedobacter nototheniae]|uniref:M15 family metallopeptidase n=1 Tax=Pedobacter nototheniae TaxID=2488994 RepID=UPI00292FEEA6|nr:M15 family metallopeptidase [Pedobacter nototheniae]